MDPLKKRSMAPEERDRPSRASDATDLGKGGLNLKVDCDRKPAL